MVTTIRIAAKLRNNGFKSDSSNDKAVSILSKCVAPVACVKFYQQNESEVRKQVAELETGD